MEPDSFEIDKKRLGYAWSCIIPSFFKMCVDASQVHGAGICLFRMVQPTEEKKANCDFHYIREDTSFWGDFFANVPNKDEILVKYDHTRHIIIGVHIPATEGKDNTFGNIRIFENEMKDENAIEVDI